MSTIQPPKSPPNASAVTPSKADPEAVTISGYVVDTVYEPSDAATQTPDNKPDPRIGAPGVFPYTRGVHAEMYRKRLWTMRQFAGFGSAGDTNKRFKYLLANAGGARQGEHGSFDRVRPAHADGTRQR